MAWATGGVFAVKLRTVEIGSVKVPFAAIVLLERRLRLSFYRAGERFHRPKFCVRQPFSNIRIVHQRSLDPQHPRTLTRAGERVPQGHGPAPSSEAFSFFPALLPRINPLRGRQRLAILEDRIRHLRVLAIQALHGL